MSRSPGGSKASLLSPGTGGSLGGGSPDGSPTSGSPGVGSVFSSKRSQAFRLRPVPFSRSRQSSRGRSPSPEPRRRRRRSPSPPLRSQISPAVHEQAEDILRSSQWYRSPGSSGGDGGGGGGGDSDAFDVFDDFDDNTIDSTLSGTYTSVPFHAQPRPDGTEAPHMVRLTPIGKTYVSYFVRESPFVNMISESTALKPALQMDGAAEAALQARLAEAQDAIAALTEERDKLVVLVQRLIEERNPFHTDESQGQGGGSRGSLGGSRGSSRGGDAELARLREIVKVLAGAMEWNGMREWIECCTLGTRSSSCVSIN